MDTTALLPWTEKYRPKRLDDVIGQKDAVESLKAFVRTRNMPNLLFSGPPGVGKTTATLALAHEMFGEDIGGNLLELNASDDRGIDIVRGKIKDFARSVTMGKVPFKIIFLDEADALTQDAQQALRRTMESYSTVTRFILSCNYSSRIIEPIQSRCAVFRFLPLTEEETIRLAKHVAEGEGLKCDEKVYKAVSYIAEGDSRKVINLLQAASLHSKSISEELVHKISSKARPAEVKEMIELGLGGKFLEARGKLDKLVIHYGLSGDDIVSQVYREIVNLDIPEREKIKLVEAVGECNFRLTEGASERIQIEAMLARLPLLREK
ncbi:MAG: replication factor C small subunit [Candidatus Bilamarchaeaceae archaeon]